MRLAVAAVLAVALVAGCGSGDGPDAKQDTSRHRIKSFRIPSTAMVPTLSVGDIVKADLDAYAAAKPEVGEIVVFHPPTPADSGGGGKGPNGQCGVDNRGGRPCPTEFPKEAEVNFIKRVVAGPGDTIAIRDGHVILNGGSQAGKEMFINPCHPGDECDFPVPIKVPPDHWFMLGDNRGQSDDSRYWGPVPQNWIIAKVAVPGK